jgi:hypothetical protein
VLPPRLQKIPFLSFELVVGSTRAAAAPAGVRAEGESLGLQECLLFGRNHAPAWDGSADRAGYDSLRMGWGWVGMVSGYVDTMVRL